MNPFVHSLTWGADGPHLLTALLFGYLLGSIPFAFLITRWAGEGDIREIGSGNVGATNVLRTGNRWAAAATLVADIAKGAIAVWWMRRSYGDLAGVVAGLGAFLGHIYPIWLRFRGGKGVAVFLGITLSLYFPVGLLIAATWGLAAYVWRISSLSALVAAGMSTVYMLIFWQPVYAVLTLILTLLIFIMHRDNLARLRRGEEPRIGSTSSAAAE